MSTLADAGRGLRPRTEYELVSLTLLHSSGSSIGRRAGVRSIIISHSDKATLQTELLGSTRDISFPQVEATFRRDRAGDVPKEKFD